VDVNFTAGAPFTATSTLTAVPGTIVANGGDTSAGRSVLTLALKDKNTNPVTGRADIAFVVSGVTDTALTAVTESPAGSGVYTATLNGTTAGLASVSPTVGGTAFSATPSSVNVTLVADPSTAAVSAFTSTTTPALANNADTQTLTATVKDAKGNVVPGATVNFTVTTGIATLGSATATTNASGVATVTVKDTTAETATITAKVGTNAADTGKTADATFGLYPVVSGISNASPAVNNSPADGVTQNTLVVQVSDLAGNAITNTAVTLSLTGTDLKTGPATLKYGATVLTAASTPSVTTDANGRVILTATDVTAETITVSAKTSASTQAAQTATSTFVVYPVLTPANLTITSDTAPADGVTTNAVQAKVTDLKGNPLSGQTVTFTVTSPSGQATGASTLTPVTDASGIATLTLTDRTMETATVKATVGTAVPANQVQTVTPVFKLFASLTMTVSNNNCAVNCTVSFAVTALDANDAPVSGLVVNTFDGGGTGSAGTAGTTNASGQVTLTRSYTAATTNNMTYAYANIAQNSAMSTRRTEYSAAHVAINTVTPVSITNITTPANPYTFTTSSGFPRTGFNGAYFNVNLSDSNPTAYTWSVDGTNGGTPYTTVDANGLVRLIVAKSGVQTVQVKNTVTGTVLASFSFTLRGWLTSAGSASYTWASANAYCAAPRALPTRTQMVGSPVAAGSYSTRGTIGGVWSEWGDLSKYTFRSDLYWSSELQSAGRHYLVRLSSGYIGSNVDSVNTIDAACWQGL
ncbi:TPA: beta strand repeat-containing protein, partial [Citrobacter amalonaticus]